MLSSHIKNLTKAKTKKILLKDFSKGLNTQKEDSLIDSSIAKSTYNIDFSSGALKTGLGVDELVVNYELLNQKHTKTLNVPVDVKKIEKTWLYKKWDNVGNNVLGIILIFTENTNNQKYAYWSLIDSTVNNFYQINDMTFNEIPKLLNVHILNQDYVFCIPTNSNDLFYAFDGSNDLYAREFIAAKDAVFHDGKLFVVSKQGRNSLWVSSNQTASTFFSNDLNGSYIDFSGDLGDILRIVSYGKKLYVIRENGITIIQTAKDIVDFSFKDIPISNFKIYKNTVCLCGDKIFMLTKSGLYCYDNLEFEKIDLGFESLFCDEDNNDAFSCFANGKYYLVLKTLDNSKKQELVCSNMKNNTLIEYDIENKCYKVLRGLDINDLCFLNHKSMSKMFVGLNGQKTLGELSLSGLFHQVSAKKLWETPILNIDSSSSKKTLKRVSFVSKYPIKLICYVDSKTYEFNVNKIQKDVCINTNLAGKDFKIAIYTDNQNIFVNNIKLEFTSNEN